MTYRAKIPPSYLLLEQEGYLISSCLGSGLTALRSAHVHNKGGFYSSLFNLSIGLERLLKAIVIIEHITANSLSMPSKKQLKNYGHNIEELYDQCVKIAGARGMEFPERNALDPIKKEIICLLSDFAQTTRYHNLDALTSSNVGIDPLEHWGQIVTAILEKNVPKAQKNKILGSSNLIASAIDDITITIMHGLDKKPISTKDALALPGLHDQAVKYAVLHVVQILIPLKKLTSELSHLAYKLNTPEPVFPQMHEFLEWLWDERQYVMRKKRWP
ncbi:hypothetical protein [Aeromonas veronii]|uniref:hypothetical protein n=1 Tax=Aeromonas veronii TaxID=654 RepID=UPI003BA0A544